jgi:hypothetical protein
MSKLVTRRGPELATSTFLLLCFVPYVLAQSASPTSGAASALPESGFVSAAKYTNAFFGFSLPLPQDSGLHELKLSIKGVTRNHFLMGLQAQKNGLATLTVAAAQLSGESPDGARKTASGPRMQETTRIEIGGKEFWRGTSQEKSKAGKMQNITYATAINGYVLRLDINSFDAELTNQLEQSIQALTFFDPSKARDIAGPDSRVYDPAASQQSNTAVIPPSNRIPRLNPGVISGNVYKNEELGFRYEFPAGWAVNDKETREKVAEAGHQFVWGNDPSAAQEHEAAQHCTNTLLFVTEHPAGTKTGKLDPLIILMAVDPGCSPGARFPTSIDDHETIQQIAGQLVHYFKGTPFASGKARVRAFTTDGRVALEIAQSFAVNAPGYGTTLNVFTSMVLMEAKDYWVAWMFEGGSEAELAELKNTKIFFDPSVSAPAATQH